MFFLPPEAPPPPAPALSLELPGVAPWRPELSRAGLTDLRFAPRPLKLPESALPPTLGARFTYTGPAHFIGPGTDLLILLGLSLLAHSTGGSVNLHSPQEVPNGLVQYPR